MKYILLLMVAVGIVVAGCGSVEDPSLGWQRIVDASDEQAPTRCPDCCGALSKIGAIQDNRAEPSKNLDVWNRSICANLFYGADSVICPNCWLAYSHAFDRWERSSELADSFRRPLTAGIRQCPLPAPEDTTSLVVYSQRIETAGVRESVRFWYVNSGEFLSRLGEFAREHDLSFRVERAGPTPNQVIVVVETKSRK